MSANGSENQEVTAADVAAIIVAKQATLPPYEPPKPLGWHPTPLAKPGELERLLARLREPEPRSNDPYEGLREVPLRRTQEELAAERVWQENAEKQKRWRQFVAAIGERYDGCRLDNFTITDEARQRPVLDALMDYADELPANLAAGRGIVLIGPCGSGKDHLLAGLARRVCGLRLRVDWTSGPQLFSDVRDTFGSDTSEGALLRDLERSAVLVLSDPLPPSRQLTDFQSDLLYRLIDSRYRNLRPTWASLNLAAGEADRTLGSQVADRLRDNALVLECRWPSYRKPADANAAGESRHAALATAQDGPDDPKDQGPRKRPRSDSGKREGH